MKLRLSHFVQPFLVACLVSCQDMASLSPTSDPSAHPLKLVARLSNVMAGDSIPAADSLRLIYRIGDSQETDTVVPWSAHHFDFGALRSGDSVFWRAIAYTWEGEQRHVTWASQNLKTQALAGDHSDTFTLNTPVLSKVYPLPTLSCAAQADSMGMVALSYTDSNYAFQFKVHPSVVEVSVNNTPIQPHQCTCAVMVKVPTTDPMSMAIRMMDTLGAIAVRKFSLTRLPQAAKLASLQMSEGKLDSTFSSSRLAYVLYLPAGKDRVTLTPTAADANMTITSTYAMDGSLVTWPLRVTDSTLVHITVTTKEGNVQQVYSVQMIPAALATPTMTRLEPSQDTSVAYASSKSITFKAKVTSPHLAQVIIDGALAYRSGNEFSITKTNLAVGKDTIWIVATDSTGGKDSASWVMNRDVDLSLNLGTDIGTLLPVAGRSNAFEAAIPYGYDSVTISSSHNSQTPGLAMTITYNGTLVNTFALTDAEQLVKVVSKSSLCSLEYNIALPAKPTGIPWNSSISYGSLTDARDGQVYKTVTIGNQTWMAENLNFDASGSWCYDNRPELCTKYGRLYDWATAMDIAPDNNAAAWNGSDMNHQGACPSGWHVPNATQWAILGTAKASDLKSVSGWMSSAVNTDNVGFRALPGGYGDDPSNYSLGNEGRWWMATESDAESAQIQTMTASSASTSSSSGYKTEGVSLRCLKD